jgi:hypothetical protein
MQKSLNLAPDEKHLIYRALVSYTAALSAEADRFMRAQTRDDEARSREECIRVMRMRQKLLRL